LTEAARANRVVVLDHGGIVYAGLLEELIGRTELLGACGLEVPPLALLVSRLRELGLSLPQGLLDPESLVGALCR
jgi:hypothetical protein